MQFPCPATHELDPVDLHILLDLMNGPTASQILEDRRAHGDQHVKYIVADIKLTLNSDLKIFGSAEAKLRAL